MSYLMGFLDILMRFTLSINHTKPNLSTPNTYIIGMPLLKVMISVIDTMQLLMLKNVQIFHTVHFLLFNKS